MSERTLEYGSNIREDFYKVLYYVLMNHNVHLRAMPGFAAQTSEQQRGMRVALDNFANVIVNLASVPSSRMGEVNPVHRPVVEELMADLQAMLDKMPVEEGQERPSAWELAEQSAQEAGARMAKEVRANVVERSADLAKKTWACSDHGIRPWQSKPGLLRAWCHKELADGTECGHELVERTKPEGMFHMA